MLEAQLAEATATRAAIEWGTRRVLADALTLLANTQNIGNGNVGTDKAFDKAGELAVNGCAEQSLAISGPGYAYELAANETAASLAKRRRVSPSIYEPDYEPLDPDEIPF